MENPQFIDDCRHCNLHVYLFRGFSIATFDYQSENHDDRIWDMKWSTQHCHTKSMYRMFNLPFSLCWGKRWWIFHEVSKCTTKTVWGTGHCSSWLIRYISLRPCPPVQLPFWGMPGFVPFERNTSLKHIQSTETTNAKTYCVGPKRPNQGLSNSWTQQTGFSQLNQTFMGARITIFLDPPNHAVPFNNCSGMCFELGGWSTLGS